MRKDRLRSDKQEIRNLDDLIEAREPQSSHFAADRDAFDVDVEIPEDVDVDSALTFPHPHRRKDEPEMLDALDESEMDEDYPNQEMLPSDYAEGYSDLTTTDIRDDQDEIAEEEVEKLAHPRIEQMSVERPTEVMPDDIDAEDITEP